MKKTLQAVIMTLGVILTIVGSIFWISLFCGAECAPDLAISFLGSGAWMLLIGFYLEWREKKMWGY